MVRVWPWKRKRRRHLSLEVPPLTLSLWLDCLHAIGHTSPKGLSVPEWEPDDLAECAALVAAACGPVDAPFHPDALRESAGRLWVAISDRAARDLQRAGATAENVERALGNFLDDGKAVTFARVLYTLDAADVVAFLGMPLWRAAEWLQVRAVEQDYQREQAALARKN